MQYKQTLLGTLPADLGSVPVSVWSTPTVAIRDEAYRAVTRFSLDISAVVERRGLYHRNRVRLTELSATRPWWAVGLGRFLNYSVFGIPTKIVQGLNIAACIVQQSLTFTGYVLFAVRQFLFKNSVAASALSVQQLRITIRAVSRGLTYALYYVTNVFTTSVSLVKVMLIGLEWFFSTI